jgi:hypothetical protein
MQHWTLHMQRVIVGLECGVVCAILHTSAFGLRQVASPLVRGPVPETSRVI